MGNQIQCPNCGGYRVSGGALRETLLGRKPVENYASAGCMLVVMGVPIFLLMLGVSTVTHEGWVGIGMLFGLFLVAIGALMMGRPVVGWVYRCAICGYQWRLKPGEPQPEVTVRPDLIQKGEQRLREEEEEARRRRLDD